MDEMEKKSSWEDLARELGADPPTEPQEFGTTDQEEGEQSAPTAPRVSLPVEPPTAAPAGWDTLADEFGFEIAEPAQDVADDESSEFESELESSEADEHEAPTWQEGDSSSFESAFDAEFETADEAAVEDVAEPDIEEPQAEQSNVPTADWEDDVSSETSRQLDTEESLWDSSGDDEESEKGHAELDGDDSGMDGVSDIREEPETAGENQEAQAPSEETPAPKASPSFWESIFGPRVEPPPLPEPVNPASELGFEASDAEDTLAEMFKDAPERSAAEEDEVDEEKPRRRRRRRRGEDAGDDAEERDERSRRRASRNGDSAVAEDRDLSPQEERGKPRAGAAKSPGHRNIPAWEDAIGVIVDANLQSRSERRQSSSRSSSRGRGRSRKKKNG